ncbi:MAG: PilZ domain-containing protein [Deltaproteobacteria bacterium]|nr:PilZ domain-containing protein [Deltaproteobacteria bacterium]
MAKIQFERSQESDRYAMRPRGMTRMLGEEVEFVFRQIHESIERLEHKLDYLIMMADRLDAHDARKAFGGPVRCDVSGSGMLFATDHELPAGTYLRMSIILGTYNITRPLHCIAKVVRLDDGDPVFGPQKYRVAVDYTHIADDDRETLIAHVFDVQRAELRARRQAGEES